MRPTPHYPTSSASLWYLSASPSQEIQYSNWWNQWKQFPACLWLLWGLNDIQGREVVSFLGSKPIGQSSYPSFPTYSILNSVIYTASKYPPLLQLWYLPFISVLAHAQTICLDSSSVHLKLFPSHLYTSILYSTLPCSPELRRSHCHQYLIFNVSDEKNIACALTVYLNFIFTCLLLVRSTKF